ncbi:putative uncharacterized protein [Parachlamydia acanthamoebae UV-7]|uniref:Uncharacterized protein n=1 Tax=Parachlamydia acanthamoebae (strain UV7) TaxID=765952 RepID=F8L002_PARAV|nr:hypothetical protein pah_c188o005 [Parachlamydia acanthamoebae str. Hall's coccus]CCB86512.1 putative uncharacterized protein [Parachlamydia acanthamoebae UV-7]
MFEKNKKKLAKTFFTTIWHLNLEMQNVHMKYQEHSFLK